MDLLKTGEHCSEQTCNRFDFLPLKCDACESIFCTNHISYLGHSCPSAYKKDVQVPTCPMCNVPIPLKRGDPPDLAVGEHIDNDCQADSSKNRRKIFVNKCSMKGCKIKEIVRVNCSICKVNFCLKHRHPSDHMCIGQEEAMRLKRLEALEKRQSGSSKSTKNNSNKPTPSFRKLQPKMSEDEALARALQASLQDEETSRRHRLQAVPSGSVRDTCSLS